MNPGISKYFLRFKLMDGRNLILALSSGLLLTAAFPKVGFSLLAWVALIPLLAAMRESTPKTAFRLGWIAGLAHYLTLAYWLIQTMKTYGGLSLWVCVPLLFLIALYQGLYIALFAGLVTQCRRPTLLPIAAAIVWTGLEYLRSIFFLPFPWELLGYSQYLKIGLIQIADTAGVFGVSFLLALANATIFLLIKQILGWTWRGSTSGLMSVRGYILALTALLAVVFMYGHGQVSRMDGRVAAPGIPKRRLAVIQGNVDQSMKWDPQFVATNIEKYLGLSREAQSCAPDLVVWPETATPFYLFRNPVLTQQVAAMIADVGADFLIGSPAFEHTPAGPVYYNSAFLVRADGTQAAKYDKSHLVPFGEYIPMKRWLPFMGKMVQNVGDFHPGPKGLTLEWHRQHLGVLICFEVIFPELSRRMVANGAGLLINITNDAWYGRSGGPHQHFSMAVFRAVENRRALVRSANTGISAFIDPLGRIEAQTPLLETRVLCGEVPLLTEMSLYTRWGDWFAQLCLGLGLVGALWRVLRPIKRG